MVILTRGSISHVRLQVSTVSAPNSKQCPCERCPQKHDRSMCHRRPPYLKTKKTPRSGNVHEMTMATRNRRASTNCCSECHKILRVEGSLALESACRRAPARAALSVIRHLSHSLLCRQYTDEGKGLSLYGRTDHILRRPVLG